MSTLQAPKGRGWRIDAEAAAGGHLVPQIGRCVTTGHGQRLDRDTDDFIVRSPSSVRRLTPRECERLQGFPDDWTLIDWQGKPAADSRRYAACGDAVTVPVAEWLGRRIAGAA